MSDVGWESRVGSQIGPYCLRRLLGKGGMGEVYEAEDTVKGRIVALKLLREAVSHDPVVRKRLQREARSAGRLQEPHVVPIHDYGEIDGLLFVDMRMIEGTDLRTLLKRHGPMNPARAVAILRQVASALDAAHAAGVMHRDVKPENILITGDDFAYLVDFGIANAATDEKLTELGTAVGTYTYMAPERFSNGVVTFSADVYALACVLHECLTGSPPFPEESLSVVITAHMMRAVPRASVERPGVPAAFDPVIARGMAKRSQDRYASAGELTMAANDALTDHDQDEAETILRRGQAATAVGALPTSGRQLALHSPQRLTGGPPRPAPAWTPAPPSPPPQPGPPPPGPPPQGPPPPRAGARVPWAALLAGATVFAIVVGGMGIWMAMKPNSSSSLGMSTPTSTTETEPAETTRRTPRTEIPESPDSTLMALVPRAYDEGACAPVHPPASGAIATVDCGPASSPSGPMAARYSLFADRQGLDAHFDMSLTQNSELLQCPGTGLDSPTGWHYTETPDKVEGRVACGTFDNKADLFWTKNAALVFGDAQGPVLEDLDKWWLEYG